MLSREDQDKYLEEFRKIGAAEVSKNIKMGIYGAHSMPKCKLAQLFVDQELERQRTEYAESNIALLKEANEKSDEANQIANHANTIAERAVQQSEDANRISKYAFWVAAISVIVSIMSAYFTYKK